MCHEAHVLTLATENSAILVELKRKQKQNRTKNIETYYGMTVQCV